MLAQVWDTSTVPNWVLLDEPEAGWDIAHQHFILQQAKQMAQQDYGVVAVLHDPNLAARFAEDVALLAGGQLLRHGGPPYALDPQALSEINGLPL